MKDTWKYAQNAKLTVQLSDLSLNIPDARFPEDGKVELLFSESPEKIAGRLSLTKNFPLMCSSVKLVYA